MENTKRLGGPGEPEHNQRLTATLIAADQYCIPSSHSVVTNSSSVCAFFPAACWIRRKS